MKLLTCVAAQSFSPNSPDTTGTSAATGATVPSQHATVRHAWWL